jgi:hypothetical protein
MTSTEDASLLDETPRPMNFLKIHILKIDTTPNPNSMKVILSEPFAKIHTFEKSEHESDIEEAPGFICEILNIPGIASIFTCQDFMTLNRDPRMDWEGILSGVFQVLGEPLSHSNQSKPGQTQSAEASSSDKKIEIFQDVELSVLTFRGIPMQVKGNVITPGFETEKRVSLPARFQEAVADVRQHTQADFLKERSWIPCGRKTGELIALCEETVNQLDGLFSAEKLVLLIQEAKSPAEPEVSQGIETFKADELFKQELEQENSEGEGLSLVDASLGSKPVDNNQGIPSLQDWKTFPPAQRSELIQTLSKDAMGAMEILLAGLADNAVNVRRWACAKLSGVDTPEVIEALCFCLLNDTNIGVRRTAGDSLSDIGNPMAEPAMCQALSDPNKLVRWRAARFLFEVGSLEALPFLQAALSQETEFENQLEMNAAMVQIQQKQDASNGVASSGPIWKQIAEGFEKDFSS